MWDQAYQEVFEKLKESLTLALVLYYYQLELPTKMEIDALDRVVARVLF